MTSASHLRDTLSQNHINIDEETALVWAMTLRSITRQSTGLQLANIRGLVERGQRDGHIRSHDKDIATQVLCQFNGLEYH